MTERVSAVGRAAPAGWRSSGRSRCRSAHECAACHQRRRSGHRGGGRLRGGYQDVGAEGHQHGREFDSLGPQQRHRRERPGICRQPCQPPPVPEPARRLLARHRPLLTQSTGTGNGRRNHSGSGTGRSLDCLATCSQARFSRPAGDARHSWMIRTGGLCSGRSARPAVIGSAGPMSACSAPWVQAEGPAAGPAPPNLPVSDGLVVGDGEVLDAARRAGAAEVAATPGRRPADGHQGWGPPACHDLC